MESQTPDPRPTCIAYIDGYNWYHAVFKHRPEWKWLNLHAFFQALRPDDNMVAVKLFSAMSVDAGAYSRQKRYFDALRTVPKTEIILGVFQERTVTCRGDCRLQYMVTEEKKTDVNLAIEIINDAINQKCDRMCIASGDSDIQPAVEWVVKNHPKIKITVYIPALPSEQNERGTLYFKNKRLNVECMFMPLQGIAENQLPDKIKLGGGSLSLRPYSWNASENPS